LSFTRFSYFTDFYSYLLLMFNCYSNWFTCITNVENIGVPFADLFGLVYNIYNLTYRGYDEFDNRTYEELLSYLCNNVTTGRLLFFLVFTLR